MTITRISNSTSRILRISQNFFDRLCQFLIIMELIFIVYSSESIELHHSRIAGLIGEDWNEDA